MKGGALGGKNVRVVAEFELSKFGEPVKGSAVIVF